MPRKPVRLTQSGHSAADAGGAFANIVDRAFENPAMSGGLMVMALTTMAIISNAMFLQSGRHPDPLFASHPAPLLREAKPPIPTPRVRETSQTVVIPPLPRLAPMPLASAPKTVAPDLSLVGDVQRELARLGLYSGAIDGIAGSRTAAAISAFETAAGRPATGVASLDLLVAMKAPLPVKAVAPVETRSDAIVATAAELDRRERERAELIANEQKARAAAQLQANYRLIQGALNRIGYGPLATDGAANTETTDAIRRFELDNGLPVTGDPSDYLIGRLIAIGAIKAT